LRGRGFTQDAAAFETALAALASSPLRGRLHPGDRVEPFSRAPRTGRINDDGLPRALPPRNLSPVLQFRLFGIPVNVEPWFWATAFLLGGGLDIRDKRSLLFVGLWMILVFVSILVHELGHALSGRRLAGGRPAIRLWAFGGLAYNEGGRFTKKSRLIMILAGPGAGFLLFGAVVAGILIAFPGRSGWELTRALVVGGVPDDPRAALFVLSGTPTVFVLYSLLWINLWWGLVNLLPVHPLDGGQFAAEFISSRRRVHLIGLVVAAGVAAAALVLKEVFVALLFGFLAWQNYENMKRLAF